MTNVATKTALSALLVAVAAGSVPSVVSAQNVAWAWVDPPGSGGQFTPDLNYQYSSSGGTVTVVHDLVVQNRYFVLMPGMGTGGADGCVHASPYDGNHIVSVKSWAAGGATGSNLVAVVETYTPSGAPANGAAFTIRYRQGGDPGQRQAYLWASNPTAANYTPSTTYSWNGNRPDPTIQRTGTGDYLVTLPGLAASGAERGHVQATPYSTAALRVVVQSWANSGADMQVVVRCRSASGAAVDGQFVLSYNESAAPIAPAEGSGAHVLANHPSQVSYTPDAQFTDSNGTLGPANSETIARVGTGVYRVHLPDVAPSASSMAQVTAYGNAVRSASIDSWDDDGCGGAQVVVRTYQSAGIPVNAQFTLLYLTNRPAAEQSVAWAYVDPQGQGNTFTPDLSLQHTPSGAPVTVTRAPAQQNKFFVDMPGLASDDGVAHVSAVGGNHTAEVCILSFGPAVRVEVELFTPTGAPANDGEFMILYRHGGNHEDREAYLWAHNATAASYTPNPIYSWNADRADPTITRTATGTYNVTLPGLASAGPERGHVQVTAYHYTPGMRRAKVTGWTNSGADLSVGVRCYNAAGAPADGRFVLSYNETAAPIGETEGSGAHVWADQPLAASYTPNPAYTDSNGTFGPPNAETITRLGTGFYRVYLPNLVGTQSATAQVTAYGSGSEYASIQNLGMVGVPGTARVRVRTYDASGVPVDARFTLLYLTNRPATGAVAATSTSYGSGCNGPVLSSLTRPVTCTNWDLELTGIPAGAVLGFVQLDLSNPNATLGLAASGCTQYTGGAATRILLLPVPNPVSSLAIPSGSAFVGLSIYAQGGALVPGINPLGLAASNGVRGVLGDI